MLDGQKTIDGLLASAVQHHIRAITVVFNDNAFGNVRRIQQERFGLERTIAWYKARKPAHV
mgnify:CR=1 FL=1